jgi:rRNA maturation endonuclease Nob1
MDIDSQCPGCKKWFDNHWSLKRQECPYCGVHLPKGLRWFSDEDHSNYGTDDYQDAVQ